MVFDAVSTDRVYRPALSRAEAFAVLEEETKRGLHDPVLLDTFIQARQRQSPLADHRARTGG